MCILTCHITLHQDIEFEQLQSLNVATSNVASTATTQSATNPQNSTGRDGLVLERGLHHRDAGTAIVSLPQVSTNPVQCTRTHESSS